MHNLKSLDDIQRSKIRNLVSGVYDIQKLRIATGNRIVQSFNIQLGQAPSTRQDDLSKETLKLIEELRKEYKLITDAYINKKYYRNAKGKVINNGVTTAKTETNKKENGVTEAITEVKIKPNEGIEKIIKKMDTGLANIKSELDYKLIKSYVELCESEELQLSILSKEVKNHPLWDLFFNNVKGCGPLMAAVCIAYFDIDRARHVSSFWRYAGLDTVTLVKTIEDKDGNVITKEVTEGKGKFAAHMRDVEYTDKDGNIAVRKSIGYNPIVKTKLVGVLADCMIKAGLRTAKDKNGDPILDENGNKIQTVAADAKYVQIYVDYKHRLNNRPDLKDESDAHKHNMAKRYMIKMFIRDLWVTWREAAGYEVSEPYEVAKLGMKPHKYNEAQCDAHDRTSK